jgi:pimeloyl-ACP methyl ester carboxylesterase
MSNRLLAPALVLTLLLSACSEVKPSESATPTANGPFSPSYEAAECPPDVEIQTLVEHSCGYLTVLEDRTKSDGRTIRLFVVRTPPPPDVEPRSWSSIGVGGDLGEAGGTASGAGAARIHAVIYNLDLRGTGHSTPNLACGEVDALGDEAVEVRSSDEGFRRQFLDAVSACRERLIGEGIDLAAYDIDESAADIEDLRMTLGIDEVAIGTEGTASRILIEAVRRYPDHIRHTVMDTPQFPQFPEPAVALEGFEYALQQLAASCSADRQCSDLTPDLPSLLAEAIANLDANPIEVTVEEGANVVQAGRPLRLVLDGTNLLRAVRLSLGGDGPANAEGLPAMISDAAAGRASGLLVRILANDPTLCAGYRPKCILDPFSWGAYLTQMCRDQLPFVDQEAMAAAAGESPAYRFVFGADNPYLAACEVWDVPPADRTLIEPLETDIPMLVYVGQLDATSPLPLAKAAVLTLPNAFLYEVPGQTHNVKGFSECVIAIRNAWVDHAAEVPPADTSCLDSLKMRFAPPT